ncbi:MAG: CO dehydrogenase/acetyl-CoA synthase subunit delta [Bacillota bacterium]
MEVLKENWTGKVREVTIGATRDRGGTRTGSVTVGGETGLPFLHFEGITPNPPRIALEVWDTAPDEWPEVVREPYADVVSDPAAWAEKCVGEYGADLVMLRLASCDPDRENRGPADAQATVKSVLSAVGVPLIIIGCGDPDKDNEVMPAVGEAAAGENCLIGIARQENYKSLVATCMVNGHNIIAQSPLDINIAKQLNILITEMGLAPERIVIDPMSGALGYGIEYCYSIMERVRLGALQGDKMLAMPVVTFVGQEAWRAKEAKEPDDRAPGWGPQLKRGVAWELMTAVALLQAGADIMVMRHPAAAKVFRQHVDQLLSQGEGVA